MAQPTDGMAEVKQGCAQASILDATAAQSGPLLPPEVMVTVTQVELSPLPDSEPEPGPLPEPDPEPDPDPEPEPEPEPDPEPDPDPELQEPPLLAEVAVAQAHTELAPSTTASSEAAGQALAMHGTRNVESEANAVGAHWHA